MSVGAASSRDQVNTAGGGELGCRNVEWKDWLHVMVNPNVRNRASSHPLLQSENLH
jgi:hypothetical protein